jgi:hypothetical protein
MYEQQCTLPPDLKNEQILSSCGSDCNSKHQAFLIRFMKSGENVLKAHQSIFGHEYDW